VFTARDLGVHVSPISVFTCARDPHVYSPAFQRGPFEPHEEDAFRDAVRATFAEDTTAELEPTGPDCVLVEHRHPRLLFHRRWGWWTTMSKPGGAVGMAATLRDLGRDGAYSMVDVAADLVRFLTLAGSLAGPAKARVVFGMDPGGLRPELDPSERIARERLHARLAGVQAIALPVAHRPRESHAQAQCDLQDLPKHAVRLSAECVVGALRTFHNARVSTDALEDSIPPLMDALRRARSM
jgi:hypothetical protein